MSLFLSSKNLCGQNSKSSFTGEVQKDSIVLDLNDIKGLTIKLLEREYYMKLNVQKDSLIKDYRNTIQLQDINIEVLNGQIYNLKKENDEYYRVNNNLLKSVERQKRNVKIIGVVGIGATLLAIIIPLIK